MKARVRMFRRGKVFWCQDNVTAKQETLGTRDRETALRLLHARNEAGRQTAINLQIARAYLAASDPEIATRKWQLVMEESILANSMPPRDRPLVCRQEESICFLQPETILDHEASSLQRMAMAPW